MNCFKDSSIFGYGLVLKVFGKQRSKSRVTVNRRLRQSIPVNQYCKGGDGKVSVNFSFAKQLQNHFYFVIRLVFSTLDY